MKSGVKSNSSSLGDVSTTNKETSADECLQSVIKRSALLPASTTMKDSYKFHTQIPQGWSHFDKLNFSAVPSKIWEPRSPLEIFSIGQIPLGPPFSLQRQWLNSSVTTMNMSLLITTSHRRNESLSANATWFRASSRHESLWQQGTKKFHKCSQTNDSNKSLKRLTDDWDPNN